MLNFDFDMSNQGPYDTSKMGRQGGMHREHARLGLRLL